MDQINQTRTLMERRIALEKELQHEKGELAESRAAQFDQQYAAIQKELAAAFKYAEDDRTRITLMLEMMRILENRLVYLQNFTVDPTSDNRILAGLVTRFIDTLVQQKSSVLTQLEATYYRAVAALYAGDLTSARQGFRDACASEESDEANDIKYKSYVILGHLTHDDHDYAGARDLHDQSLRYSPNANVTAQALALKALNHYALQAYDDARRTFEEALGLFDPAQPFFNSYFFRNSLLFCGAICFDKHEYETAEKYYRTVIDHVDKASYDYFDAFSHLGRIAYHRGAYDEAVTSFDQALQSQKLSENEYIIDTWFWIARSHLKRNEIEPARSYLQKIADSDVRYEKKPQAVELLAKVS